MFGSGVRYNTIRRQLNPLSPPGALIRDRELQLSAVCGDVAGSRKSRGGSNCLNGHSSVGSGPRVVPVPAIPSLPEAPMDSHTI